MGRPTRALGGAVVLAAVAGGLFFQGLGRYPLLDPDEARHAEVAREMGAASGVRRLFLPTLDLEPYREKPAGYYWLVVLAYGALGVGEVAARAVSALAALVAVLALYAYALPRGGPLAALGAGVLAATSVGWFGLARYGNLDMTLTACVTVGVLAGLAWLERPAPRRGPLAPYVAAGLGLVVKGPLALVLVAGPLALAALVQRPRPRVRGRGRPPPRGVAAAPPARAGRAPAPPPRPAAARRPRPGRSAALGPPPRPRPARAAAPPAPGRRGRARPREVRRGAHGHRRRPH